MSLTLTESDIKLLSRAWLATDGGSFPKIDYDKLAALTGFTKGSTRVMWNTVKKKVEAMAEAGVGAGDGDSTFAAATPKKTPKKRAAKDADATTDGTPKKRGRRSKAQIAADAAAAAAAVADSDDEEGKAKVKKEEAVDGDDGVNKLLTGAKEFSKMDGAGLIGADSDDEV